MSRRLVVSVCLREPGTVVLPLERGGRPRRLDARAVARCLEALAAARGVADRVCVRQACAGGCWTAGPNVSVTVHPLPEPGERPDQVAIGWKTYVYTLPTLAALATILDENLGRRPPRAPRARSGRAPSRPGRRR